MASPTGSAEPVRAAARANTSAEAGRRLDALAGRLDAAPTGDRLRAVRAVEALERMGTADARRVLTLAAAGAPGATLTREAEDAIGRAGRE